MASCDKKQTMSEKRTMGKALAEWMWDYCGSRVISEAQEVFAQKFVEELPEFFDKLHSPSELTRLTKRPKLSDSQGYTKSKELERPSLGPNQTLCRYCQEVRPKPGIGGHETRCAEKLGKAWTPRSRDSPPPKPSPHSPSSKGAHHSPPPKPSHNSPSPVETKQLSVIKEAQTEPETQGETQTGKDEEKEIKEPPIIMEAVVTTPPLERSLVFDEPSSSPPPSKATKPKSTIDTHEVFPCVSLTPYRVAQMLGRHAKESRTALLIDYWSKIDPDGYYKVVENSKDVLADGTVESEVRLALASTTSSSSSPGSKGSPTMNYSQKVKEAMAKLLHNMPPGFDRSASTTKDLTASLHQSACRMKGRRHEGQALRRFELRRGIRVSKDTSAVTYIPSFDKCSTTDQEGSRRFFDPEGEPNGWKLYGKLDGRIDKDTLVEVKTRMYGLGDHIPIQDTLQMQTYMEMFDALKCIHLEFHPESGRLRDRTVLRNQAQWDREIYPGIQAFVKDLHRLLSRDPTYNAYKLHILRTK